jgi:hypothetical protein
MSQLNLLILLYITLVKKILTIAYIRHTPAIPVDWPVD